MGPKRFVCSYPLVAFQLDDLKPQRTSGDDCGPWAGYWPANESQGTPRPAPAIVPNIAIVQAPNVPIVLPAILRESVKNKKARNKNKENKKRKLKKHRNRKKALNKTKRKHEKNQKSKY